MVWGGLARFVFNNIASVLDWKLPCSGFKFEFHLFFFFFPLSFRAVCWMQYSCTVKSNTPLTAAEINIELMELFRLMGDSWDEAGECWV